MLDPHFNHSLQDRDGVFWYELFECHEECCLQSDAAGYRSQRSGRIAHGSPPGNVDGYSNEIGDEGCNEDDLAKLFGAPCSFQVSAAQKDSGAIDEEGENVLFDECGSQESPGIEDGDCRYERQIWNARLSSHLRRRSGSDQLPPGEIVEEGQRDKEDEQAPGDRRNV